MLSKHWAIPLYMPMRSLVLLAPAAVAFIWV
jgi:hypothetical protein